MHRGFSGFLRKHRRLLPIIGAGIVLLTFVVKDTWKDKVRGIADTVEEAQRNHLIREDNENLMSVVGDIYQRVRYPGNQAQDVDLIASRDSYQVYLVVLKLQQQIQGRIHLIVDLVDHLPGQETNKQTVEGYSTQLDGLQDQLLKIEDFMTDASSGVPGADRQIPKEAMPLLTQLRKNTSLLWHAVQKLDASVLSEAKATKDRMDYWFGIWSVASLVLFAAGWTLGLIGQIYGVQTGQGGG